MTRALNPSRLPIVAALIAILFMAAIEATVVATAMPTIAGELGGLHLYAWVFAIYLLASTISVPIYGKLADVYGRKPVLSAGVLLFVVASVGCGLAGSMEVLIAFRALQGLGAGAMQPISMTIIGDLYRVEERARIQGVFGAMWGFAGTAGPFLGSLLIEYASWRWVFLVNVPFAIVALGILAWSYKEQITRRERPLDVAGAVLLTLAVVALLNAEASLARAAVLLPVTGALVWLFVLVERRAADPLLPPSLFKTPFIRAASVLACIVGATMMPVVSFLPLVVQGLRGGDALAAGLAIMPMTIAWPIASFWSGKLLVRLGARPLVRIGMALVAVGTLILALAVTRELATGVIQLGAAVLGFGLGFSNSSVLVAVQETVGWSQRGVATSSQMFFRTMAGSVAVAALGAILSHGLRGTAADPVHGGAMDGLTGPAAAALAAGLGTAFWIIAALGVLGGLFGAFFPGPQPRPQTSREVPCAT